MQILTILVIEDEDSLLQLYRIVLEKEGFKVLTVHNGQEAWDLIENEHVDLVITDILMPVMDGYEFTKLLRHSNPGMPVLMITAKDDFPSKNKGFSLGTDDYMTKPFSPSELVARVKAHINRYESLTEKSSEKTAKNETIEVGDLKIDRTARRVFVRGEEKNLTSKEFDLLYFLAKNPNHVFPKEELFQQIWDVGPIGENGMVGDIATVTVHIKKIREKIEQDTSNPEYIETIWGVGYRFRAN